MHRLAVVLALTASLTLAGGFTAADLLKLRSVGTVKLSPDGSRVAYIVTRNDGPRKPIGQLWIMTQAGGKTICLSAADEPSGNPEWSPDGKWIAYSGKIGDKSGLSIARPDGSEKRFLAPLEGTNAPLPTTGRTVAWSPDGKQIAYVTARPGPETADATGDPIVITRYLYKPDAAEGNSHFNDNRRLHIFVTDAATGQIRQLTDGTHYEHSIDWSPDGREIAFVSNREPNEDQFFNYDLFALNVASGAMRRLTATENAEYQPRWSPDGKTIAYLGTKRGLTDLETTMEDTHVWLIDADGHNRRELTGSVDNRQFDAGWSPDGKWVYFIVEHHGSNFLARIPATGGRVETIVTDLGGVGSWGVNKEGNSAYSFSSPPDASQIFYCKPHD